MPGRSPAALTVVMPVALALFCFVRAQDLRAQETPPAAGDPGPVPAEQVRFDCSADYAETWAYLQAAAASCRHIHVASCGYSTEGRPIPVVMIWDRDRAPGGGWEDGTCAPVVLITACIHAGEPCGNDALQLLVRDIARGLEPDVIAHLRLILVPIFNVDGHVRRSPHHRFTQNGPACGTGTRRSADNLDLNRDYAKLESSECQAIVRLASQFQPHIYIDLHTNDGMGHQYDILYSSTVNPSYPAGRGVLMHEMLEPHILTTMRVAGFHSHPFVYPVDRQGPSQGMVAFGIDLRYGTGYFESRQALSILSEAYPYVSYERRVRATDAFVRAILRFAVTNRIRLCATIAGVRAEARRWALEPGRHEIALACHAAREDGEPIQWLGKTLTLRESEVTGFTYGLYGDRDTTYTLPLYRRMTPSATATMPRGYLLEAAWGRVAQRLKDHGIAVYQLTEPFDAEVEVFRITDAQFRTRPYQGHHPITDIAGAWSAESRSLAAGSYWIPLDQPAGLTAMHLLEPESPDGLLVWNAFDAIFERGIILEWPALEEHAQRMLEDPGIRADYEAAFPDTLAQDEAKARLLYLFDRSAYAEEGYRRYPAFRSSSVPPAHRGL